MAAAVMAAVLLIGLGAFLYRRPQPVVMTYNQFLEAAEEGRIKQVFYTDGDLLRGETQDGTVFVTDNPRRDGFKEMLLLKDIAVDELQQHAQIEKIGGFILTVSLFGGLLFFLSKNNARQTQGGFGKLALKSVQNEETVSVTFRDVAGNEEAKESIREMVDFIRCPEKYARYGARLPRGILFYGSPGTGKTLMARAVAGEAGVPFYAVSGSDFVQVYVGVGAGRIRDLFKKARESGKCVIFIDEIDALGKKRDGGLEGGGNDERDQTLNALLAEMSGFHDIEGIVVIAATNRMDTLDEALLRPGRFDRHIEIGLPDVKGRLQILRLHCANKPMDGDVDLMQVARQTVYFSGAKLESLMNEAAIIAARRNSGSIRKQDIDQAFYTVIAGAEKKDRSGIKDKDRQITAYHEAGHALITKLAAPENTVSRITIIPSTRGAGGFSMNIPPDRMYHKKKDMENSIRIALAGRAAEEIIFGADQVTTGASNDLQKATEILLNMVRRYGMNQRSGLLNYDVLYNNGFRQIQDALLDECKDQMEWMYTEVKRLLEHNRPILEAIAEELLQKENLDEAELEAVIKQNCTDKAKGA